MLALPYTYRGPGTNVSPFLSLACAASRHVASLSDTPPWILPSLSIGDNTIFILRPIDRSVSATFLCRSPYGIDDPPLLSSRISDGYEFSIPLIYTNWKNLSNWLWEKGTPSLTRLCQSQSRACVEGSMTNYNFRKRQKLFSLSHSWWDLSHNDPLSSGLSMLDSELSVMAPACWFYISGKRYKYLRYIIEKSVDML